MRNQMGILGSDDILELPLGQAGFGGWCQSGLIASSSELYRRESLQICTTK